MVRFVKGELQERIERLEAEIEKLREYYNSNLDRVIDEKIDDVGRLVIQEEKLRKALREAAEALPDPMSPRIGGKETEALQNALKIIYDALGEE